MSPVDEIERRATALLRTYLRTEDPLERTQLLKQFAELIVDLREHFLTDTGEPDWRGSTYAYKIAIGDLYRRAGFQDIGTISAAVRYHVGNVLRERLTPEQLEDLGLRSSTPRARSVEKRERNKALMAALRPGYGHGGPVEPVRGLLGAATLLARIDAEAVAALSNSQCERA